MGYADLPPLPRDAFRAAAALWMLGAQTVGEGTVLARAGFLYAYLETAKRVIFLNPSLEKFHQLMLLKVT